MDQEGIRILIADDHPLIRSGIHHLLANQPGMTLVAEASDGNKAVDLYRSLSPDVVLMDLRMPRKDGVTAIKEIMEINPEARVIVLTNSDNDQDIVSGLDAGACGYMLKDTSQNKLVEVIKLVHAGESYLPNNISARLLRHQELSKLSPRELEVLNIVKEGKNNKAIALELGVTESTIKSHIKNILLKLNVNDRTQAVTKAIQLGILTFEK